MRITLKLISIILLIGCQLNTNSQDFNKNYLPLYNYRIDSARILELGKVYSLRSVEIGKTLKKETSEAITELYDDLKLTLTRLDSIGFLMYNDTITNYCNSILARIISNNPDLQKRKFYLFVRRSYIPNASNMSEGVIMINLSLLNKLRNEDEIAFVICHEIGHDVLDHVQNNIVKIAKIKTDKNLKKDLKKIYKSDYNQMSNADSLINKITQSYTKYTRKDEISADSLGLVLFCNSGYEPSKAVSTLLYLDSLDIPLFDKSLMLEKRFSFNEHPFNPVWIYEDTTDLNWVGNIKYEIPDSLKTHPDCDIRAKAIESQIKTLNCKRNMSVKEEMFIRKSSLFEMIKHFEKLKAYDYCLYYSLSMLNEYPENVFLHCNIVNSLFEISEALKNHEFSDVVRFPDKENSESFNKLLLMLNQMTFGELNTLCMEYFNSNIKDKFSNDPFVSYIEVLVRSRSVGMDEAQKLTEKYINENGRNEFSKNLERLFTQKPKN